MRLSLIQYRNSVGETAVAVLDEDGHAMRVPSVSTICALASLAIRGGESLAKTVYDLNPREPVDLDSVIAEGRLLPPIHHEEPSRLFVTGTGLTHLGSVEGRDAMHRERAQSALQSDSMKMFLMGIEGGKPTGGRLGVQPEWFYKGIGDCIAPPGGPITTPAFALDGAEEAEIAGIYMIGPDTTPTRLGFCLANEFSDHVTERTNYLWLAHSKLREASLGPELLTGPLPDHVEGTVRIVRNGSVVWQKRFLTGEANMSHSIENIERHHFKYRAFRRPGDIHVHFFGASTFSYSDGVRAQSGDIFEIEASPFHLALRNTLMVATTEEFRIRSL